jgi:hypothetical protein
MIAASGGDTFLSGALLGIVTGFLMGLVFRSWLVWRIRSRARKSAAEAARAWQAPMDRVATNGQTAPRHSARRRSPVRRP